MELMAVVRWAAAPRRQRLRPPSKQASSRPRPSAILLEALAACCCFRDSLRPRPALRRTNCLCALPCAATTRTTAATATTSAAPDYTDASGGVSWRVGRSGRPVVLGACRKECRSSVKRLVTRAITLRSDLASTLSTRSTRLARPMAARVLQWVLHQLPQDSKARMCSREACYPRVAMASPSAC